MSAAEIARVDGDFFSHKGTEDHELVLGYQQISIYYQDVEQYGRLTYGWYSMYGGGRGEYTAEESSEVADSRKRFTMANIGILEKILGDEDYNVGIEAKKFERLKGVYERRGKCFRFLEEKKKVVLSAEQTKFPKSINMSLPVDRSTSGRTPDSPPVPHSYKMIKPSLARAERKAQLAGDTEQDKELPVYLYGFDTNDIETLENLAFNIDETKDNHVDVDDYYFLKQCCERIKMCFDYLEDKPGRLPIEDMIAEDSIETAHSTRRSDPEALVYERNFEDQLVECALNVQYFYNREDFSRFVESTIWTLRRVEEHGQFKDDSGMTGERKNGHVEDDYNDNSGPSSDITEEPGDSLLYELPQQEHPGSWAATENGKSFGHDKVFTIEDFRKYETIFWKNASRKSMDPARYKCLAKCFQDLGFNSTRSHTDHTRSYTPVPQETDRYCEALFSTQEWPNFLADFKESIISIFCIVYRRISRADFATFMALVIFRLDMMEETEKGVDHDIEYSVNEEGARNDGDRPLDPDSNLRTSIFKDPDEARKSPTSRRWSSWSDLLCSKLRKRHGFEDTSPRFDDHDAEDSGNKDDFKSANPKSQSPQDPSSDSSHCVPTYSNHHEFDALSYSTRQKLREWIARGGLDETEPTSQPTNHIAEDNAQKIGNSLTADRPGLNLQENHDSKNALDISAEKILEVNTDVSLRNNFIKHYVDDEDDNWETDSRNSHGSPAIREGPETREDYMRRINYRLMNRDIHEIEFSDEDPESFSDSAYSAYMNTEYAPK